MQKLTFHARIEIVLASALLLGSCNAAPTYTADEAHDLAEVARANSVAALAQISDLEERVADLEQQVESNGRSIEVLLDAGRLGIRHEGEFDDRIRSIEARLGM